MNISDLRRNMKNSGLIGAAGDFAYRAINRFTPFMILRVVQLTPERVDRKVFTDGNGYSFRFLDESKLRQYATDPALELNNSFLDESLAKGDRCYAILDGDVLASYGWYSNKDTAIDAALALRFGRSWVYMYKGFTHPAYRGQRLHAVGMFKAMQAYCDEGLRGIISYVEANNFSSLKSIYRMGYLDVGNIVAWKVFGKYRIHVDKSCKSLDVDLLTTYNHRELA